MVLWVYALLVVACTPATPQLNLLQASSFEADIKGQKAQLFTLKNTNNMVVQLSNLGARIVSVWVPDKNGEFADVCFGYKTAQDYLEANVAYCGASVGRFAGRIGGGKFILGTDTFRLSKNTKQHTLHGGRPGFHERVWRVVTCTPTSLTLRLHAQDGEAGFPGNLQVTALFELTDANALTIHYTANTDKATHVNLTSHGFFNLTGDASQTTEKHLMQIHADYLTEVDGDMVPTGKLISVANTPFDFRQPTPIGKHIDDKHEQLSHSKGYDHTFVLNKKEGETVLAATIKEPQSGRIMEVFTNQPGLLFSAGSHLPKTGGTVGKYGVPLGFRSGFCLETQHFPNSPNVAAFPSTLLKPNETYNAICTYAFKTE